MKTKVTIAIFMLMAFIAQGQNETLISPDHIDEVKVTPPEFAGISLANSANDLSLINSYLLNNLIYPEKSADYFLQGTEVVQFTVTTEGKVTDFKIINSVSKDIDQEMIRVLQNTNGMWKPGYNNNKPVDMLKEVSMLFYLNDQNKPVAEMFRERATGSFNKGSNALFEKHNVNKALRCFNEGIIYLPYDKSLLLMRGICRYEVGDKKGALEDWNRMSSLGETIDMKEYAEQIKETKGYDELMAILKK